MKAVAYQQSLEINKSQSLLDIELPQPVAAGRDLLLRVKAIAVNPVDCKIRRNKNPAEGEYRVLGWDAVAEVVAVGEAVSLFKPGDRVFYAGELNRQGSNAEYQLVDERLVGHKPKNLSDAEAAAIPLTAITAWELLFEHLAIAQEKPGATQKSEQRLLIVGAAGGVGSVLIQLAKAITGVTVIATASRESSRAWVKKLGADYIIDHGLPMLPQLQALGIEQVTHIASLNQTESYFDHYPELLATFGKIAIIDDSSSPLDPAKLKLKSQSLHIEFMFARSMFQAADMDEQGRLLNQVSTLLEQGYLKTTVAKNLGKINAENLKLAHAELESRQTIGKLVLEGF